MSIATNKTLTKAFNLPHKKELLISGYFRKQLLPQKIKYLCILFAFNMFENQYIPFSTKFKTKKGIVLTENNQCASKSDYHRSSWIVSDIEPVQYGIHCWRILVNNPNQAFIRFGVGSKRAFSEDSVYGIAYDKKRKLGIWRPAASINKRNKINLQHFSQKKCAVDMLLDATNGVLKICIVGMCDDQHEAKIWGMATTNLHQRWVPHFTFGTTANGATLQVTEIYHGYYGKDMNMNPMTNIEIMGYVEKFLYHNFALDAWQERNSTNTFTFHFCGIQAPKSHKTTSNVSTFDDIKVDSCITVESSLTALDTIQSLKNMIRKTYELSSTTDIVIFYSDKIISCDDALKLNHFGVTDGSLFLLAIANYSYCVKLGWSCKRCTYLNSYDRSKCEMCEMCEMKSNLRAIRCAKVKNPLLSENKISKQATSVSDEVSKLSFIIPMKGFDIITQESNVDVYYMPGCNHVMSKESLYHYALTTFKDDNNLYLKCPHPNDEYKSNQWACRFCTYNNKMNRTTCEMCENAKPEQKPYCEMQWEYSSIKQILLSSESDEFETYKLELLSARNKIQKCCDVQTCPACNTLYYRKDDKDKLSLSEIQSIEAINAQFKTRCILCDDKEGPTIWKPLTVKYDDDDDDDDACFCWGCGKLWDDGHICDTSFKKDLVDILLDAKTKKIGSVNDVPSIRACPKCAQLITHSDACKHMKCESCKCEFCFVCLKPKTGGNWQCGSHSSVCPVEPPQNMETLPNTIVLNKNTFKLF